MFKAIKDNKIIAISETNSFDYICCDSIEEDTEHSVSDYVEYDTLESGQYLLKSEIPAPTKEEQSEKRAIAYRDEVDPITAHISRLRDAEQTEEVVAEIEALIAKREAKVAEIKEQYPYPTDPIYEE